MRAETIMLDTRDRRFVDITSEVAGFVKEAGEDGLVNIFLPHATAGLALMETGSGSEEDLEDAIERLLPREDIYRHHHGSKGHGADHLLPAFIGPSLTIPVVDGVMTLGTWQSIVVVDPNRDNPHRKVRMSFLGSE
jgi:secondary thiamine-phosphate synthase enzyme